MPTGIRPPIGPGVLLLVVAFFTLTLNEFFTIRKANALNDGAGSVKRAKLDKVDPSLDNKLVHLSGTATVTKPAIDSDLNITAPVARLKRTVETYQWKEKKNTTKTKLSNGNFKETISYDYNQVWSDSPIDSSSFNARSYRNPPMPYRTNTFNAGEVTLGAYSLSPELVALYSNFTELPLTAAQIKSLPKAAHASLVGNGLYIGDDATEPQIGDTRISYQAVTPGPTSIIALQSGDSFKAWQSPSGSDVLMLEPKLVDAPAMFNEAQSSNGTGNVIWRVLGWGMLLFSLRLMFKPLVSNADLVPVVGPSISGGVGFFSFIYASLAATFLMGLGSLFGRPVFALFCMLASGGIAFFLIKRAAKKQHAQIDALGVQVHFDEIERQSPESASMPVTDSVVKGHYTVSSNKPIKVVSRNVELLMQLTMPNGKVEEVVLASDTFPHPMVSRSEGMLVYPFNVDANNAVKDGFIVSIQDPRTNQSSSIPDALAKRQATIEQAAIFVRTSVRIEGLGMPARSITPMRVVS